MFYFYIFLTFLLTCLGIISGMGGGVVLKPVMDMAGEYDAATIGVLTATAVFVMALVSFVLNVGVKSQLCFVSAAALGLGAVGGGFLGQMVLKGLITATGNDNLVKLSQNIVLGVLELGVLAYTFTKNAKRFELSHSAVYLAAGVSLGVVSAFLGIGGGAINVALLMFLFGMDIKKAAVYSLLIILFSQGAKLLTVAATDGLAAFSLMPLLPCMAVAAVAGSLLGAALNNKLSHRAVLILFGAMLCTVLCAVGYNIVKFSAAL